MWGAYVGVYQLLTHPMLLLHMATAMPKKLLGYYHIISLCKLYKNAKKKNRSMYSSFLGL